MNKRINEIAKQAGYVEISDADFANSLNQAFHQKFAELIIRQCADISNTAEPYKSSDLILQYFGLTND